MDAVEYIKENKRMCDSIERDCGNCKIYEECLCRGDDPEKWVSIVEKWAKEHPTKTRMDKLLEAFPNADVHDGFCDICPKYVEPSYKVNCNEMQSCTDCGREYWTEEVE